MKLLPLPGQRRALLWDGCPPARYLGFSHSFFNHKTHFSMCFCMINCTNHCLLAAYASGKGSTAWLNTLNFMPFATLGLRMDDATARISIWDHHCVGPISANTVELSGLPHT